MKNQTNFQTKIAVITGSRADFGLLRPLLKKLVSHKNFELQLIACAGHLLPSQGLTVETIKHEGFEIAAEIDMLLASDTPRARSKAIGLGVLGFSDAYERLQPHAVLVLGDRFEILAASTAAMAMGIPLIHLEGGQVTQGAIDNMIRNAISKMSHLHFTASDVYRARLIRMGEQPEMIYNVGATGLEELPALSQKSLRVISQEFGFDFTAPYLFITLHSENAQHTLYAHEMAQLLCEALAKTPFNLVFTGSNADAGGEAINAVIQNFVQQDKAKRYFRLSFGVENFLSTARHAMCVVGNSTSGMIEVPSFGVPTLNIGNRQKGCLSAPSVIHCEFNEIESGLMRALSNEHRALASKQENPLGTGETSQLIFEVLEKINFTHLAEKVFDDAF